MSLIGPSCEPELCGVAISTIGVELGEVVSRIRPET
jgi:hypothetical protein